MVACMQVLLSQALPNLWSGDENGGHCSLQMISVKRAHSVFLQTKEYKWKTPDLVEVDRLNREFTIYPSHNNEVIKRTLTY